MKGIVKWACETIGKVYASGISPVVARPPIVQIIAACFIISIVSCYYRIWGVCF